MTLPLCPGAAGEPVPSGEDALRLVHAAASKDGKVTEAAFILSEGDKASALQSLSVFMVRLTTPHEARALMEPHQQPFYSLYALLAVDAVRALRPLPDSPDVPALDVVWDPLEATFSSAAGHAGITGLLRPAGAGVSNAKLLYKSLRSQLADLANGRIQSLPSTS